MAVFLAAVWVAEEAERGVSRGPEGATTMLLLLLLLLIVIWYDMM
jgi:hypothetical protein